MYKFFGNSKYWYLHQMRLEMKATWWKDEWNLFIPENYFIYQNLHEIKSKACLRDGRIEWSSRSTSCMVWTFLAITSVIGCELRIILAVLCQSTSTRTKNLTFLKQIEHSFTLAMTFHGVSRKLNLLFPIFIFNYVIKAEVQYDNFAVIDKSEFNIFLGRHRWSSTDWVHLRTISFLLIHDKISCIIWYPNGIKGTTN